MSQPTETSRPGVDPVDNLDNVFTLLRTLGDTSWRMLLPTALLAAGGLWADLHWQTKPWLTVLSVPLGLGVSVWLVRRQLRRVQ